MNDAHSAQIRYSADRVNTSRNISAQDYAFMYLPFDPENTLLKMFEEILNKQRDITELDELLDMLNTILAPNGLGDFIQFYKENTVTGANTSELYYRTRDMVISDLKSIKEMLDYPENALTISLIWFAKSINILFLENVGAEN